MRERREGTTVEEHDAKPSAPAGRDSRSSHLRAPEQPIASGLCAEWQAEAAPIAATLGIAPEIRCDDEARSVTERHSASGVALEGVVYLHPDRIRPGTPAGRRVLVHELVHVAQARLEATIGGDPEHEAETLANASTLSAPRVAVASSVAAANTGTTGGEQEAIATAAATLGAIEAILRGRPDASGAQAQLPAFHTQVQKTVPERHATLLHRWSQVADDDGFPSTLPSAGRREQLAAVMAETEPLVSTIVAAKAPQWIALVARYRGRTEKLRDHVLDRAASDAIGLVAGKPDTIDLADMTEDARLAATAAKALTTSSQLLTGINRILSGALKDRAASLLERLNNEFHAAAAIAGETHTPFPLQRVSTMSALEALVFVKAGLDGVRAILTVADPETRAKLFAAQTGAAEVGRHADIALALGRFTSGAVAVLAAATYGVARVTNNGPLAVKALAAIPALNTAATVLNVVSLVRGVAILLDDDASAQAKADATIEVASASLGLASKAGISSMSVWGGPLTLSLVVNYHFFDHLLTLGEDARRGMIVSDFRRCLEDMRDVALDVQTAGRRLAAAIELEQTTQDPELRARITESKESLRRLLFGLWIRPYLERATRGTGPKDPAHFGPRMIRQFQPLVGRTAVTAEGAVALASDFVGACVEVFADAPAMFEDAVRALRS